MDKTYKVAVIVGNPKVNDMSDGATELLNRIAVIRESGRFESMFIMPADKHVASRLLGAMWRAAAALGFTRAVSKPAADASE